MMRNLDQFDLRILECWQRQGDIGPQVMSEKVNLSASQCSRRMQWLRVEGYVTGMAAVLDAGKLDIGVKAYVLLTLRSHEPMWLERFRQRILALDEVLECQSLTGGADIILKVATRNLQTFNAFLNRELLNAPDVATARSSIVLDDLKSTTALPLRFVPRASS